MNIQHTLNPFCCMVSGISDQYAWKSGNQLPQYYLFWASGMCGFTYVKYKKANPPGMIFFGINTKNQYDNICRIMNCSFEKYENLIFKSTLARIKYFITKGLPVIIGPLDMYYLPYLKFFQNTHIPIHYLMVIGFNETSQSIIVYDCDKKSEQNINYDLIKDALDVNVPGIGKKNTIHIFHWPEEMPSIKEVAYKSLLLKVDFMLNPHINNLGINGMRKLAGEIINWPGELSESEINKSLHNMVEYMNDRFRGRIYDGGRIRFADEYLNTTAKILEKKELHTFIGQYHESGNLLDRMAKSILANNYNMQMISSVFKKVADIEENIYRKIKNIIAYAINSPWTY
ncbi:MAG: DUF4872 domain-containing protein [Spirochaetales bacterium]|nr:DUF4872 domain-containing protein [Spirochaetales bacterium]